MDNTVLKATLLCVWKGVFYSTTMAFVLFYIRFYSIPAALLLSYVQDCCVCCCCCCCCYTVGDYRGLQWLLLLLHRTLYWSLTYCCFVASSSSSFCCCCCSYKCCCLDAFVTTAAAAIIIVPFRGIDSIWFDSFSFHGSFACRCNKINNK